jgi:hypothetical protein
MTVDEFLAWAEQRPGRYELFRGDVHATSPENVGHTMHWLAVIVFLTLAMASALAQNYPTKPIHVIVPYAPGGVADIAARLVGQKLTESWRQQVVVENRTGGNGFIAVNATAKAPADGYTLLVGTVGEFTINPALFKDNAERQHWNERGLRTGIVGGFRRTPPWR